MSPPRGGIGSGAPDLRQRLGVGALLVLLILSILLTVGPLNLDAVRLLGVSISWWYGGVLSPLLAVLITVVCLGRPGRRHD